ncbi:hypothetical protein H072_551 [Dactylellina haptotyla CBS 200.50]|uniref:Vacuolar protein sorting-associated protein 51 homolog n=1 Tax=Dactylellina haptotyla (strain CBS 200.50) TaxID=1284197 RepID=S8CCJ5_DACHA|nr:hypothetical protein H072_551 [Dactylellina haptotyla CBS 200.50]
MTSTPTIAINSPPTSSRPSLDSSVAHSRLSSDSLHSLASLPSHAGTPVAGNSIRAPGTAGRRNRSALREFYGINKRDASGSPAPPTSSANSDIATGLGVQLDGGAPDTAAQILPASELDGSGFDARACVDRLVAAQGLRSLLRVENGLINDIRGFDGERKSLVYDNYNKLIAATDTIRSMRSNMEPMTPTTTTLLPAISHIASLSSSLVENVHAHDPETGPEAIARDKLKKKQEAVRYIMDTPERLKVLVDTGRKEEAVKEWEVVKGYVQKWKGVGDDGVKKLLDSGEVALAGQ